MVLGFLNTVSSSTTVQKKQKTHLKKRNRYSVNAPKKSTEIDVQKSEVTTYTTIALDETNPSALHNMLFDIDQRIRSCETYLADMNGKMNNAPALLPPPLTVPALVAPPVPPPLPPPLPPPVFPTTPALTLKPLDLPKETSENTIISKDLLLEELKKRVSQRKIDADANAIEGESEVL